MTDVDSPLAILKQLIQIPSQNPMGIERSESTEPTGVKNSVAQWYERGISDWLCQFFDRHNFDYQYDEICERRGNVIATLPGVGSSSISDTAGVPAIMLDAHQDTVPATGMSIDPFDPVVKDGRIYGRGACDVKGAMASILCAMVRLQKSEQPRATVIATFLCDEEHGQIGASRFAERYLASDTLLTPRPSLAIISEPTQLDVVVAHKGTLRWRIRVPGIAAHSSDPSKGRNAIYAMAKVVNALEACALGLANRDDAHPLCGAPSLSVGTIAGGKSVNIVPNDCVIEIDRRLVPGEDAETVMRDTEAYLKRNVDVEFEMLPMDLLSPPLADQGGTHLLAERLRLVSQKVRGESQICGVPFSTHAPQFAAAGIPTVVFGPGSIAQAHTVDEWIAVDQLDDATKILVDFVHDMASGAPARRGL